jgi:hypothetical protein
VHIAASTTAMCRNATVIVTDSPIATIPIATRLICCYLTPPQVPWPADLAFGCVTEVERGLDCKHSTHRATICWVDVQAEESMALRTKSITVDLNHGGP